MTAALPWWKRTTVYQIYPRSFSDSNHDGIGDLQGIIGRLDYLEWLGVETLWISPFYASPQADFGYDISGHFDIAPEYGTLADVDRLIEEVHARGMKIVFDMVLNHTSAEHPWFLESKSSRDNPRRDYYIWRDGEKPGGKAPPNNWKSMIGGSGWRYDATTDQWYWATFLGFQPDLNWRNPRVKAAMLDVVRHWLSEGADGLRLDLFNALFKDESFADNPRSWRPFPTEHNSDGFFQKALHTQNHPDTIQFARELRQVVDEFSDPPRFVVGEVFGDAALLREYCGQQGDGLNLVFLFKSLTAPFSARGFHDLVSEIEHEFPDPLYPTYVFSNHDRPRAMNRLRDEPARARLLAAFQLTVRGVPFIYYGEEIGMSHPSIPKCDAQDPVAEKYKRIPKALVPMLLKRGILINRDEARSPMLWDDAHHHGFSAPHVESTWMQCHPHGKTVNVAVQRGDVDSVLSTYRRMLHLRTSSPALSGGSLEMIESDDRHVLAYRRIDEHEVASVWLNFSGKPHTVALGDHPGGRLHSSLRDGVVAPVATHELSPWEAIVVLTGR